MVVDPRERAAANDRHVATVAPLRGNLFLFLPTPAASAGNHTQLNTFLGLALRWALNSHIYLSSPLYAIRRP